MLFNSWQFIFVFLPITFVGFFLIARVNRTAAAGWLAAASLFFYGWWDFHYIALLLLSICLNYGCSALININNEIKVRKSLLILGITGDLTLLGYYKYTDFLIGTLDGATGAHWALLHIVLPLGISFFTFTQIAYLVDTYRKVATEKNFLHYVLFVTYFPHLIAGPILHHKQMMPQFAHPDTYTPKSEKIFNGLSIFFIGLSKKMLIADSLAPFADSLFAEAERGHTIAFFDGWAGALAYTFQLYFDFSGYSDMAIGLSLLFGITLPINFDSPYKSVNIIDFWRKWHMTLSQFLRDYLYISLGGGRVGKVRRYINLLTTMVLGGLWHGANWTFVIWGALHGTYLVINHGWRALTWRVTVPDRPQSRLSVVGGTGVTFFAVVIAWVVFRATSISSALEVLKGMAGLHGFILPEQVADVIPWARRHVQIVGKMVQLGNGTVMGVVEQTGLIAIAMWVSWAFPSTQNMSASRRQTVIFLSAGFFIYGLFFTRQPPAFLYFQF